MSRGTSTKAAHVVSALRQRRIIEAREQLGAFFRRPGQRRGGAAPVLHERLDSCDQPGIARHQDAGLHDLGVFMPTTLSQLTCDVLQRFDLSLEGRASSLQMRGALRRCDKFVIDKSTQHDGLARDDAWRGADPWQGKLAH